MILTIALLATAVCTPPYALQPNSGKCQAVFTEASKPAPNSTVDGQPVTCEPVGRYNAVVCTYEPQKGTK